MGGRFLWYFEGPGAAGGRNRRMDGPGAARGRVYTRFGMIMGGRWGRFFEKVRKKKRVFFVDAGK